MYERLERKRHEMGMSVKKLAEISTVPEGTCINILKGKSKNPSFDSIYKLCMALSLSCEDVFSPEPDGSEPVIPPSAIEAAEECVTKTDMIDMSAVLVRLIQSKEETIEKALASKDAQYAAEKAFMLKSLERRDRWIRVLAAGCALMSITAIVTLIV